MDNAWLQVLVLTVIAGGAIPFGALLAAFEHIRPDWLETEFRHTVIAFGGGVLLSAVALVLVPEGIELVSMPVVVLSFLGGGLAFMGLDILIARSHSSASQLMAMLADFLPEAIALGATFARDSGAGLLLALIMALQNLPEGFNAYRETIESTKMGPRRVLLTFAGLSLLGPICGLSGYLLLRDQMGPVGALMLFAAGGILYLTIQDIAPQAFLEKHWAPPVGAVAGFLLGIIGHMILVA